MIVLNFVSGMLPIKFGTQHTEKGSDTFQTRLSLSRKVIKWRYSDHSCGGLFHSNISFWFHFYWFLDSVVFFTSSETGLHRSFRLLVGYLQCKVRLMPYKVLLFCILNGFEAIVMVWGYCDCLLFLLIYSLSTKVEPA